MFLTERANDFVHGESHVRGGSNAQRTRFGPREADGRAAGRGSRKPCESHRNNPPVCHGCSLCDLHAIRATWVARPAVPQLRSAQSDVDTAVPLFERGTPASFGWAVTRGASAAAGVVAAELANARSTNMVTKPLKNPASRLGTSTAAGNRYTSARAPSSTTRTRSVLILATAANRPSRQ